MKVTNLKAGDVFQSVHGKQKNQFFLQITEDGDCGVFLGEFSENNFQDKPIIFRIIPVEKDIKREMNNIGNFCMHKILREEYFYLRKDVDGQDYQKFSIVDPKARGPISEEHARGLELLAFWEACHIDDRLDGRAFFPDN